MAKMDKAVWFWVIIAIVFIAVASSGNNDSSTNDNDKFEKNKGNKVTVVDLSNMTEAERDTWCNENKVNCTTKNEYSETVAKDGFISQSVAADKVIYEGDKITISISLGKEPTTGQKNALKKAESYSNSMHMSKRGIYKQLTSEYGEGFTAEEAQYAIDNMKADWNANALAKAKSYQTSMSMSKSAIYNQLTSEYGEEFTAEEAQYAIDHLDD
jgi:beta-lactam-binding protein with PASTA domain